MVEEIRVHGGNHCYAVRTENPFYTVLQAGIETHTPPAAPRTDIGYSKSGMSDVLNHSATRYLGQTHNQIQWKKRSFLLCSRCNYSNWFFALPTTSPSGHLQYMHFLFHYHWLFTVICWCKRWNVTFPYSNTHLFTRLLAPFILVVFFFLTKLKGMDGMFQN
jgi:hypothetical protein